MRRARRASQATPSAWRPEGTEPPIRRHLATAAFAVATLHATTTAQAHPNDCRASSCTAAAPATADTSPTTAPPALCTRSYGVRKAVVKKHGARAPGRNICRAGVKKPGEHPRAASTHEKATYLRALKVLNAPPPRFLSKNAGPPGVPPASTLSPVYAPTGQAACIVERESGGDPQANNGTHFGVGQWDLQTWAAHGGTKYAASPLGASKQEQLLVLASALRRFGSGAWSPWDGC